MRVARDPMRGVWAARNLTAQIFFSAFFLRYSMSSEDWRSRALAAETESVDWRRKGALLSALPAWLFCFFEPRRLTRGRLAEAKKELEDFQESSALLEKELEQENKQVTIRSLCLTQQSTHLWSFFFRRKLEQKHKDEKTKRLRLEQELEKLRVRPCCWLIWPDVCSERVYVVL
jgi:hypothetical protein